jgi:hypothetical protein
MAEDRLAEIDDRVGVAVDGLADRALQLISAAHWDASSSVCRLAASISQLNRMTQKDQSLAVSIGRWVDPPGDLIRKGDAPSILGKLRKKFR